jgi:RES domain-containing protein
MRVWRICPRKFAEAAFSGDGPRLFSGRWNPAGVPMVYTSLSLSLAAMEVFVHLEVVTEPDDLVSIMAEVQIDEAALRAHGKSLLAKLPADWHRLNHPALQAMGVDWVSEGKLLALLVPSAVIPGEWNLLLNPAHPDAKKIKREEPRSFNFDSRMFKNRSIV